MEDYQDIIAKIKGTFLKHGLEKEDINKFFRRAIDSELEYLTNLYVTYGFNSEFYNENNLENLKSIIIPKDVLNFYIENEPQNMPIFNSGVRLLSLKSIRDENCSGEPSGYLIKYGIITIATTIGGNVICLDLNELKNGETRVLIVDNNFCSYNEDLDCVEIINAPNDFIEKYGDDEPIELSYENIKKCVPEVAKSFSEFMYKLANDEYGNIEKMFL
ncbi:SMI1/KNR4 family protein [Clostridium estertheticum]|uniref:SMI1/KNR4 family protein n=1 Tax=Clostridium estertheticum TaxID=238834 RepID=UPI001C0C6BCC|nr:SMI1/KNR4 family protein [Clostridium estertheticum]MBU3218116.1 hypothetical protein [Clostridium estertheticum]WAG55271.1 SMI1/KNR4 family protein [Clostridium estertheticum]